MLFRLSLMSILAFFSSCGEIDKDSFRKPGEYDAQAIMRFKIFTSLEDRRITNGSDLQVKGLLETDVYEYTDIHLIQVKVELKNQQGDSFFSDTKQQDQMQWNIKLPEEDGAYSLTLEAINDEKYEELLIGPPTKWELKFTIDRTTEQPEFETTHSYDFESDTRKITVNLNSKSEPFVCSTMTLTDFFNETMSLEPKERQYTEKFTFSKRLKTTLQGPYKITGDCRDRAGNVVKYESEVEGEVLPELNLKFEGLLKESGQNFSYRLKASAILESLESLEINEQFSTRLNEQLYLYFHEAPSIDLDNLNGSTIFWAQPYERELDIPYPATLKEIIYVSILYTNAAGNDSQILSTTELELP